MDTRKIFTIFTWVLAIVIMAAFTQQAQASVTWNGTTNITVADGDVIDITPANGGAGSGILTVPAGATVSIIGTAENLNTNSLQFDIGAGATVNWKANASGNISINPIVAVIGPDSSGHFNMISGSIKNLNGLALYFCSTGNITISGGAIESANSEAIGTYLPSTIFNISGSCTINGVIYAASGAITITGSGAVTTSNLIIPGGTTLTNNGSISIDNGSITLESGSTLANNGTITGTGEIKGSGTLSGIPPNITPPDYAALLAAVINAYGTGGGTGTALSATVSGNTVTVTGNITGAAATLTFNINTGLTVNWGASVSGNVTLIDLVNSAGNFTMTGGALSNSGSSTITSSGAGNITVSGGTVTSNSSITEAAIRHTGSGSVAVSGGEVKQSGSGDAISADVVTVSGGTVESVDGIAINSLGINIDPSATVIISGGLSAIGAPPTVSDLRTNTWQANTTNSEGGTIMNSATDGAYVWNAGHKWVRFIAAPAITSANNTSVVSGAGGTFQVTAIGTAPITYSLSGHVASEVSINAATGEMTIDPTAVTQTFTIKATNIAGFDTQAFTLTVTPVAVAPGITGPTSMTLTVGYAAATTAPFTLTGSPTPTVTASGNAAITWNNANRTLDIAAGLSAGSYPVVLTASNSAGSDSLTFTLTVSSSDGGGSGGGCGNTGVGTLGALVMLAAYIGRRRK